MLDMQCMAHEWIQVETPYCKQYDKKKTVFLSLQVIPSILRIVLKKANLTLQQGIDGSTRKPSLVPDTNYMVEKTYHIAPLVLVDNDPKRLYCLLGTFWAYLMFQGPM